VPRAVSIFPKYSGYEIIPDKEDGILYVLQYMLSEIALNDEKMGVVAPTGVYDEATVRAIRQFKRRNLLSDTDNVDVETLNRIFDEYERIISDSK
jgi:peptidoglycan hydrolase-like protein with peptidoglycan-binding domain